MKFKVSIHLDFPLNRASNNAFDGGYGKRSPVSRTGAASSHQSSLANEDIVKFESHGQHDGA